MNDKTLKNKAVKIQGKSYVLVADRIVFFNDNYPNGQIETELVTSPESEKIVIKAIIIPDVTKPRRFTGYSQATVGQGYINRTSALENAETSAVGRALAMMGIGVIESVASVDEINKAKIAEVKTEVKQVVKTFQPTKAKEFGPRKVYSPEPSKEDLNAVPFH